jgi:hypothetical protein
VATPGAIAFADELAPSGAKAVRLREVSAAILATTEGDA